MAAAAGLEVCLHGGGRDAYGQHLSWAMPNTPWCEYYIGSDPGVPLEEVTQPGARVPRNSYLEFAPTGPGFDLVEEDVAVQNMNRRIDETDGVRLPNRYSFRRKEQK